MNSAVLIVEAQSTGGVFGQIKFPEIDCLLKRLMIGVRRHVYHRHVLMANVEFRNKFRSQIPTSGRFGPCRVSSGWSRTDIRESTKGQVHVSA